MLSTALDTAALAIYGYICSAARPSSTVPCRPSLVDRPLYNMWVGNLIVYCTPAVAFFAWCFSLLALWSPHPIPYYPLLVIKPAVSNPNAPVARLGVWGSCQAADTFSFPICSSGFDFDLLPNTTARGVLTVLRQDIRAFSVIGFGLAIFTFVHWFLFLGLELFAIKPRDWHADSNYFKWISFLAFVLSLLPNMAIYMVIRKTRDDFNLYNRVRPGGTRPDDLIASLGPGFLSLWVASGMLFHCTVILWVNLLPMPGAKPPEEKKA